MNILKKGLFSILIVGGMLSASTVAEARSKVIQAKGSDTILNVSQSIAENYMKENRGARIAVTGGGSGVGISSLLNGTTDIAMASRNIKEKEISMAKSKGIDVREVVLGFDGITIVANLSNLVNISQIGVEKLKKELLDILDKKIEEKGAEVEFNFVLTDNRDYLKIDFEKISMILKNLIENGIIYNMNKNPRVMVDVLEKGDRYLIQVKDNGMGIPIYEQDKIFERFYRIDQARTSNLGGTGLGLSIVKTLVDKCGGDLIIDSQEHIGTTFSFYILK